MALGGYKFRGYKYTCPANYDSTDDSQVLAETLKMHKCKLKAFTESCAASGAQWDFSYSNGDYSFGTHGNVIYKMDSSGFNLVSFFRYGTEDAYYAIVTLNDAGSSSGYSLPLFNRYYKYSGTTQSNSVLTNDMSCISLIDLNAGNINVLPSVDRLCLTSDTSTNTSSSQVYISKSVPSDRYYSYITKNKCIVSIITSDLTGSYSVKMSAIDALNISSPNDTKNIFSFTITTSLATTTSTPTINHQAGFIQTLRQDGVMFQKIAVYNTNYNVNIFLPAARNAISFNPSDNIPYEAAILSANNTDTARTSSQNFNTDGILTKGQTLIDLLAVNTVSPYNALSPKQPCANGNYLLVYMYIYTTSTNINYLNNRFIYIGWDPSNPDITQESAWTAYTG
jgi:hypothetical protein